MLSGWNPGFHQEKVGLFTEKNVEALDKLSELTSFTMVLRTFMVLIYGFISKLIGGLEHEFYFSIYWE